MKRKIAIASDHGGFGYKRALQEKFHEYEWLDLGPEIEESVDYPDYAHKLAEMLAHGEADTGVLVCGTGIGISIAANRHAHVRAALCTDSTMARLTREHNDANVLAIGQRIVGLEAVFDIVQTFLETEFEGGRHVRRVEKININSND